MSEAEFLKSQGWTHRRFLAHKRAVHYIYLMGGAELMRFDLFAFYGKKFR